MENYWEETLVQTSTGLLPIRSYPDAAEALVPDPQIWSNTPSLELPHRHRTQSPPPRSPSPRESSPSTEEGSTTPTMDRFSPRSSPKLNFLPSLKLSEVELVRELERSRIHFIGSEFANGDTLILLDCPECPRDYRRQADCGGMAYQSQQLRMSSAKLLATGSSKFAEMLGPTYQFRIKRRRRMGDELVFQMTELSLTPGLIKWWTSASIHKVDPALVTGHDDVCYCSMVPEHLEPGADTPYFLERPKFPIDRSKSKYPEIKPGVGSELDAQNSMTGIISEGARINPYRLLQMKTSNENQLYEVPSYRNVPEYCPFRHRNTIIRLLSLIEGKHVMLDSAIRMWTLTGVAKIFDCTSLLRDEVAQWIMHGNNVRFIEVLPEEALRIGHTLQIPQVTQCAFRILVNELAIDEAATVNPQVKSPNITAFGRKRGDLGDELSNLVQHAARGLVERVTLQLQHLRSHSLLESLDIPEWNKLCCLEQQLELVQSLEDNAEAAVALMEIRSLMNTLREAVPDILAMVEDSNIVYSHPLHTSMDFDRATYVEPKDYTPITEIMAAFNFVQRLLCPMAYHQITEELGNTFRYSKLVASCPINLFKRLDKLITAAELALQKLVVSHPRLVAGPDWNILFNTENAGGENRMRRYIIGVPLVDPYQIGDHLKAKLQPFFDSWIRHDIDPALNITRHLLLTLNNDEMKFLPLWAGGCNDGTGGVFEPFVPPADLGPNGPGPAYHTGITVPSAPSSSSGTLTEDLMAMKIMGSTTAGSIDVHDSISTVYRADRVIADDVSVESEAFTATGSDFQDARFAVPVAEQRAGQALEVVCDISATDEDDSISTFTDTESRRVESIVEEPSNGAILAPDDDDDNLSFVWDEWDYSDPDDDMGFN
ncbi:hypothetical protein HJFPF1_00703 [Paramyrothecium foliicola]|nr:hypothetical protein HJFPF1_00703 [Paramyrothecium foliicola]